MTYATSGLDTVWRKLMASELAGKNVIVTGSAHGIGRAEAELAHQRGAVVVVADTDEGSGRELVGSLQDRAYFVRLDVSREEDWTQLAEWARRELGEIHGLINNAGIYKPGSVLDTSVADFAEQVAVNQIGTFLGMKIVAGLMKEMGGGSIVNTASIVSLRAMPNNLAYSSTKWAVRGMTRVAAYELAPHNIRVNAVLPGFVATRALDADALAAQGGFDRGMSRPADPTEIAEIAVFLLSDRARFVTGSDYLVDGGWAL